MCVRVCERVCVCMCVMTCIGGSNGPQDLRGMLCACISM